MKNQEDDHAYFASVCEMPACLGLAYRRQGESRVGIRVSENVPHQNHDKLRLWEAKGVPRHWTTGTLSDWLSQAFKYVQVISNPTKNKGRVFKATHDGAAICPALECDDAAIAISQFLKQTKAPAQKVINRPGTAISSRMGTSMWHKEVGHPAKRLPPARDTAMEVAPTQLDNEKEDSDMSGQPDDAKRPADAKISPAKKNIKLNQHPKICRSGTHLLT